VNKRSSVGAVFRLDLDHDEARQAAQLPKRREYLEVSAVDVDGQHIKPLLRKPAALEYARKRVRFGVDKGMLTHDLVVAGVVGFQRAGALRIRFDQQ
jgi:hypothetical protein